MSLACGGVSAVAGDSSNFDVALVDWSAREPSFSDSGVSKDATVQ
jgi:hypothetical protein